MKRIRTPHFRLRVALLIESSRSYGRAALAGVAKYVRDHEHWSIFLQEQSLCDRLPAWFKNWEGDGIITRIENPELTSVLKSLRVPAVFLRNVAPDLNAPAILTDNAAVSRVAYEHLQERGFRHFAFCGYNGADYSDERRDSFTQYVQAAGPRCHVFGKNPEPGALSTATYEEEGLTDGERVAAWIKGLPKPVGLMTCNDMRGLQVLSACRAADVAVPDEVAVIGVDDEKVLCDLSDPPLSSVQPNAERIGYEAALLLDQMMAGKKVGGQRSLIEPIGVITRRSTEVLAIEDRQVAAVTRFIRNHACEGIDVSDILRAIPMSRSTLERRFQKIIGHSPKHEILRVRLREAKRLLAETDMPISAIAEKLGFQHPEYLGRIFKRKFELTPAKFRARSQTSDAADRFLTNSGSILSPRNLTRTV